MNQIRFSTLICFLSLLYLPGLRGKQEECSTSCKRRIDFDNFQSSPSIIYSETPSQFGNTLLVYATLLGFKKYLGFDSYISKQTKDILDLYFTPKFNELPVLQDEICNWKDIPWEVYLGHFQDFHNDPSFRKGRFIYLWPQTEETPRGYALEDHGCDEQVKFGEKIIPYLKKRIRFPPHISKVVKNALTKVRNNYPGYERPEFIGIHNRRTDHIEYTKKYQNKNPLSPAYFKDAMEYFREDLQDEWGIRPVFIYVSDDMDWGRKRLGKEKDIYFLGKGVSEKNNENQVYDFALLLHCNKSIITRGTYSMWVSVFLESEYYSEHGPISYLGDE